MAKYQTFRATALYERLSKDDELQGESNSISNQKMYLEDYARKNGFHDIRHFTDDGYTGTNFNRPGFQSMLSEIESGRIGTVIVKDMSRFGRNYLQVGFYTEMLFPQKEIRFIAINNGVDSAKPQENDFTPFLNIMNEFYAKDTSNKIKSVFKARMENGKRCSGNVPYGFYRLPDDKQQLYVDPVAGAVVRQIFDLAASGTNLTAIAEKLSEMHILIPSAYNAKYHPEQNNHIVWDDPYRWRISVIASILDRREYLGHTVLHKTEQISFKTKKRKTVAPEDRLLFPNTHEAIVDEETWNLAHKYREASRQVKRVPNGTYSQAHILCGFLYCADCGQRMRLQSSKHNGHLSFSFRCGSYASDRNSCTSHSIPANSVEQLLLTTLKRVSKRVFEDEKGFAEFLKEQYEAKASEKPTKAKAELQEAKKRFDELDNLIRSLYENFVSGKLPERQYQSLMRQYDEEQTAVEAKMNELSEEITEQQGTPLKIDRFVALIKKYKEPTELTNELVRELLDKIVVHQAEGKGKEKVQRVDIYFNFVGNFELAYTKEELAEQAQKVKKKYNIDKEKQRERGRKKREKAKAERYAANDGHKFPKRVCEQCGNEFWPNSTAQKFCSTECARAHQDEERKRKRFEEKGNHLFKQKKCIVCGKPFWPTNGQELMCSDECKLQHRRECQREYYRSKVSDTERKKRLEAKEKLKEQNGGHLLPQRECEYCGELYWPVRESQKYCCKKCCNAAVESQRLGRDVAEKEGHKFFKKVCAECGKEFWPNGPSEVCCSDECKASRMSRQHKERYAEISAIKNAEKDGHKFPQQTCEFCGKEYWPTTPNQRHCSPDCLRNGRISARHDGRNPAEKDGHPYFERTCIVCGKKFWPNGPSTKTCSEECRRERARQQGREFRERQKQTEAEKTA